MANTEMRSMTVVFKAERERSDVEHYTISVSELDRLAKNFADSHDPNTARLGVYDVIDQHGKPRKLMLRFADVLYIG